MPDLIDNGVGLYTQGALDIFEAWDRREALVKEARTFLAKLEKEENKAGASAGEKTAPGTWRFSGRDPVYSDTISRLDIPHIAREVIEHHEGGGGRDMGVLSSGETGDIGLTVADSLDYVREYRFEGHKKPLSKEQSKKYIDRELAKTSGNYETNVHLMAARLALRGVQQAHEVADAVRAVCPRIIIPSRWELHWANDLDEFTRRTDKHYREMTGAEREDHEDNLPF